MTPEQVELLRSVSLLLPGTKLARVEPMERNSMRITDRDGDLFLQRCHPTGRWSCCPSTNPPKISLPQERRNHHAAM